MRLSLRGPQAVLALALLAVPACTRDALGPSTSGELSPISIRANTSASAVPVEGIAVVISAADIPTDLVVNLSDPESDGTWVGSIEVPVGSNRTVTGTAYGADGLVTHTGSETGVTIGSGPNTISLALAPADGAPETGTLTIDVTLGNQGVEVSLSDATIGTSETTDAFATVTGVTCTPTWASSNPAVASITASTGSDGSYSATVTAGVATGSTDIVVSCGGFVGSAELTVN